MKFIGLVLAVLLGGFLGHKMYNREVYTAGWSAGYHQACIDGPLDPAYHYLCDHLPAKGAPR